MENQEIINKIWPETKNNTFSFIDGRVSLGDITKALDLAREDSKLVVAEEPAKKTRWQRIKSIFSNIMRTPTHHKYP